ncbi:transcription factor MYB61-like [Trifolium pratense]|uniref:transcription factor MYB61-like n=1 Tax=Trifolium pratense TaxID=57577 RepID=UPI001E695C79|nr:transcription factor MYB61-like [Trifolium pratense]
MSSSSKQEKNNDGDSNNNTNRSLKKGTWSKDEDKILVDYVTKYGARKWNEVQKRTELARSGNCCRFRWINHLQPGVVKGKFSEHEAKEVIRMKKLNLKWCDMAKQLPGRSDNDIKNFWNARERKLNRENSLNGSSSLSHDHELNDNREKSLSGSTSTSQQVDSQDDKYSKQFPKLFDDSNKQLPKFPKLVNDSNMFYTNVGSTSISNHTTPSGINRAGIGTSFMHEARVPNPSSLSPYLNFQNMYNPLPSIEHKLHRKYPSRYDEINAKLFDVSNKELPKWVDDSKMPYYCVGSTSTSKHTTPTWTNRVGNGTSSNQFTMVPNPLPPCSYVQNMDYQLPSYKKLGEYPQNPLPPPKEAQYQRTGSVSPYNASRVRSSKVNLVDENGKKPISFENDFGANSLRNFTDSYLRRASSLLDNGNNNNLNDKLPHDVKDTLNTAINEKGIDWDRFSYFGSFDNNFNNNLHDKIPHNNDKILDDIKDTLGAALHGKGIDSDHFPDLSSSDNDDNNNLHDKIPHNMKDTLDAVIYGKSFHPK